ncbi:Ras GTPase activating protein ira2 [Blastocladiella emersonii ATCC 22665]|nr:Ras GTPase activating protein ira2 [Blastocladiella emersonii ATCC 22665]
MAEGAIIPSLVRRLREKFPLKTINQFGSSVETRLDKDGLAVLQTLKALALDDQNGTAIIHHMLSMAMEVHRLIDTHGATNDVCASIVVLIDIIADLLYARWFPESQQHLIPLPSHPPLALDPPLAEALLQWLRQCMLLRDDAGRGLLSPYLPVASHLHLRSSVIQSGEFHSDNLPDTLLTSVGRVAFAISASNWETFYNDVQVPLLVSGAPTPNYDVDSHYGSGAIAAATDITLHLAGWGLYDGHRIRCFLQELSRALPQLKKERRVLLLQIFHHILWTWIELYPDGFQALVTGECECSDMDERARDAMLTGFRADLDTLFDTLAAAVDLKKKVVAWPLALLAVVLNSDKTVAALGKVKDKTGALSRRAGFIEYIRRALKAAGSGGRGVHETLPIVVVDILKLNAMLAGTSAERYLSFLVEDTLPMCIELTHEVVNSIEMPDSLPDVVVVELLALVIAAHGATFLDAWRSTNSLVAMALTCQGIARLGRILDGALLPNHHRPIRDYMRGLIAQFCYDDDALSEESVAASFMSSVSVASPLSITAAVASIAVNATSSGKEKDKPKKPSRMGSLPGLGGGSSSSNVNNNSSSTVNGSTSSAGGLGAGVSGSIGAASGQIGATGGPGPIIGGGIGSTGVAIGGAARNSVAGGGGGMPAPAELPLVEMLGALEQCTFLAEDPDSLVFLYRVMVKCVRPLQRRAVQIFLQCSTTAVPEVRVRIASLLVTLQRHVIRISSDDPTLAYHMLLFFTSLLDLHAGSTAAAPLDWRLIHSEVETMVLLCQCTRDGKLARAARKCLQAVLRWNATAEEPLFSSPHNRDVYTRWLSNMTFDQYCRALTDIESTPNVQLALDHTLTKLPHCPEVDTFLLTSFLLAAPSHPSSDVLDRALHSGRFARIHPSTFLRVHPGNLQFALSIIPTAIREYDDEGIATVLSAVSSYDLRSRSPASLGQLAAAFLPRLQDFHAQPYLALLGKLFPYLWWDSALLDPVLDRVAAWVEVPANEAPCMDLLERLCAVHRFVHPTTDTGRVRLQQLFPRMLFSEKHTTALLHFDVAVNVLIAGARLKLPPPWILQALERRRTDGGEVSIADFLSEPILLALNAVVPLSDLDDAAQTVFHYARSPEAAAPPSAASPMAAYATPSTMPRDIDAVIRVTRAELAVTSQPQTFLRNNVFAVKLASLVVRQEADAMVNAVQRVLASATEAVIEVDPDKMVAPSPTTAASATGSETAINSAAAMAFERLEALCESMLTAVLETAATATPRLRILCKALADLTETKFPTYRLVGLGNLVFLRLVCPAIVSSASPLNQRARTLIAKVIQNTANGVYFGGKEEFMSPMNSFVAKFLPQITAFLESLCCLSSSSSMDAVARGPSPSPSLSSVSSLHHGHGAHQLEGQPARYLHLVHKYRDAIALHMVSPQREQFMALYHAVQWVDPHLNLPLDPMILPTALQPGYAVAGSDPIGTAATHVQRWFYHSGTAKSKCPVYTLVLKHIPLTSSVPNMLAAMYQELRHAASVPVCLVVDATFSVMSSPYPAQIFQQLANDCAMIIDKILVMYCTEPLLAVVDVVQPAPILVAKLENLLEHVPGDVLPMSHLQLLADHSARQLYLSAVPLGQYQVGHGCFHLVRAVRGKAVHELYHATEIHYVRGIRLADQVFVFVPKKQRLIVIRLRPGDPIGVIGDLATMRAKYHTPDVEMCRSAHGEKFSPALTYQLVYSTRLVASVPDYAWAGVMVELCAHMVLGHDTREKLMCVDRLGEAVNCVPPAMWTKMVVTVIMFLSASDPAMAEVALRLVAKSQYAPAFLEELLLSLELGLGSEYDATIEAIMTNHIRLMSCHNEKVYERFATNLRALIRQPNAQVKLIQQQARFLRTSLAAVPRSLSTPTPVLIWTLHVAAHLEALPAEVTKGIRALLWHGRTVDDWASFTGPTTRPGAAAFRASLVALCREHLAVDGFAFVPSLRLLCILGSEIDTPILEASLAALRDRSSAANANPLSVVEILEAITTALGRLNDEDASAGFLAQLPLIAIATIGAWGSACNEPACGKVVTAAVQLATAALHLLDENGVLVEKPLAAVLAAAPKAMAAADRAFGVSFQAHLSIAVGLILSRIRTNHRAVLEPLLRQILVLARVPPAVDTTAAATKPAARIPDVHAGYLFPLVGSRALAHRIFPHRRARDILAAIELTTASRVLLVSHLLQTLDAATTTAVTVGAGDHQSMRSGGAGHHYHQATPTNQATATVAAAGSGDEDSEVASATDQQAWVLDWLEAVHADTPALFALFLDSLVAITERLVAARHGAPVAAPGTTTAGAHAPYTATGTKPAGVVVLGRETMRRTCDLLTALLHDEAIVNKAQALRSGSGKATNLAAVLASLQFPSLAEGIDGTPRAATVAATATVAPAGATVSGAAPAATTAPAPNRGQKVSAIISSVLATGGLVGSSPLVGTSSPPLGSGTTVAAGGAGAAAGLNSGLV